MSTVSLIPYVPLAERKRIDPTLAPLLVAVLHSPRVTAPAWADGSSDAASASVAAAAASASAAIRRALRPEPALTGGLPSPPPPL